MSDSQVVAAIAALRAEMLSTAAALRGELASLRGEMAGKLDFICEQLNRAQTASPPSSTASGVQRVAQPVADQVEGQHD